MSNVAMLFGLLLIAEGLYGYLGVGDYPKTALIPAGFGVVLLVLGLMARQDHLRKHAMHAAAMIGLLGFLGGIGMGLPKLIQWLGGRVPERPQAVILQLIMGVLCAIFVGLCIRSFISARRQRTRANASVS